MKYLVTMRLADGRIWAYGFRSIKEAQRHAEKHGANIQSVSKCK